MYDKRDFVIEKTPFVDLYIVYPQKKIIAGEMQLVRYDESAFSAHGLTMHFVQDNQSFSQKRVLRGLHIQRSCPQGRLAYVVKGSVFDVVVDMRSDSEMYGKWFGVELSAENGKQLYIPEGFAHGFYAIEDAVFCYKVSNYWHPEEEVGIPWDDPAIGIRWPLADGEIPVLAQKDRNYRSITTWK